MGCSRIVRRSTISFRELGTPLRLAWPRQSRSRALKLSATDNPPMPNDPQSRRDFIAISPPAPSSPPPASTAPSAASPRRHEPGTVGRSRARRAGDAGTRLIKSAAEALDVFDFEPVAQEEHSRSRIGAISPAARTTTRPSAQIARGSSARSSACAGWWTSARSTRRSRFSARQWDTPIVINPRRQPAGVSSRGRDRRRARREGEGTLASSLNGGHDVDRRRDRRARRAGVVSALSPAGLGSDEADRQARRGRRAARQSFTRSISSAEAIGKRCSAPTRIDTRTCTNCHVGGKPQPGVSGRENDQRDNRRKPMIADIVPGTPIPEVGTPTWEFIKRLKDATR